MLALSALGMAGCDPPLYEPHYPTSLAKAGSYHVSVVSAIPFDSIRDKLAPKYSLTADQAVDKVIPTTTYYEDRLFQAFSAAVGIGLPKISKTGSLTTNLGADGQYTTTGQQVINVNPGQAPKPPDAPAAPDAASKSGAILATGDKTRPTGKDPILQYNLATALYQEVVLLEAYVSNIEKRSGLTPYILRLNVSIQPYARNQPYDAYVDIGFFHNQRDRYKPPFVVPLLVTDNLEGTNTARTAEAIIQLTGALSAMVGGADISASAGFTRDRLKSIAGTDLNSTLTVSRTVDNVVKVRLGAPRQPTAGYAMIPRNHTVSVLVLADIDKATSDDEQRGLQIVTKTSLREVETGELLAYERKDVFKSARDAIRRVFASVQSNALADDNVLDRSIPTLVRSITRQDVSTFKATLRDHVRIDPETVESLWQSLWTVLSETSGSTEFQGTSVILPKVEPKPVVRRSPVRGVDL